MIYIDIFVNTYFCDTSLHLFSCVMGSLLPLVVVVELHVQVRLSSVVGDSFFRYLLFNNLMRLLSTYNDRI